MDKQTSDNKQLPGLQQYCKKIRLIVWTTATISITNNRARKQIPGSLYSRKTPPALEYYSRNTIPRLLQLRPQLTLFSASTCPLPPPLLMSSSLLVVVVALLLSAAFKAAPAARLELNDAAAIVDDSVFASCTLDSRRIRNTRGSQSG